MDRRERGIVDFPIKRLWFRFRRSRAKSFLSKCIFKQTWRNTEQNITSYLSYTLQPQKNKKNSSFRQPITTNKTLKILQTRRYINVFVSAFFFLCGGQTEHRTKQRKKRVPRTRRRTKMLLIFQMRKRETVLDWEELLKWK